MTKRDRPSWDEYFMGAAIYAATRSSCLIRQVGAVVVSGKEIVGTGYNGAFSGFPSCYENGVCRKISMGIADGQKNSGACPAVHAEINATQNALKRTGKSLGGCTLFSVLYPCDMCAKEVAGAGIDRVVYLLDYHEPKSQTESFFSGREKNPVVLEKLNIPKLVIFYRSLGLNPGLSDWNFTK